MQNNNQSLPLSKQNDSKRKTTAQKNLSNEWSEKFSLFSLFLLSTLLGSCGQYYYDEEHRFQQDQWTYADTVVFEFDIRDTNQIYNVFFDVEHHVDYKFENLYSKVYIQRPDQVAKSENISLELADDLGNWKGDCGDEWCNLKFNFKPKAYFPKQGIYRITMEQYNRQAVMEGLRRFRMYIDKTQKIRGDETSENS